MRIYLIQHGEAKKEEEDPQRGLSKKGKKDTKKIGKFLKNLNIEIDKIWHSPKNRARETAEILENYIILKGKMEEVQGLSPMDEPEEIFYKINELEEDLILVGHLPNLSKLSSLLICNDKSKEIISFKMGSILCLEKKENNFQVCFFITPEII